MYGMHLGDLVDSNISHLEEIEEYLLVVFVGTGDENIVVFGVKYRVHGISIRYSWDPDFWWSGEGNADAVKIYFELSGGAIERDMGFGDNITRAMALDGSGEELTQHFKTHDCLLFRAVFSK
jgi:hypothetical protein